jgi:hypothetical protein
VFRRRFLLPAAALLALALPAPASAVVNGDPAPQGTYPAQGFLGVNLDLDTQYERVCGGTLVGSRQFLTAARCVVNASGIPLSQTRLTVRLGDVDLAAAPADNYAVTHNDVNTNYVMDTGANDVAMLTLARPADYEPMRVVDDSEDSLWVPGTVARVLGWGELFEGDSPSDQLHTGDVSILTSQACSAANPQFDATTMVCAAGTQSTNPQDPCKSDSGSPLLAPDGGFFVLAGVFSGASCSTASAPGIYARVGDNAGADGLNKWVHDRTPEANFVFDHAPRAGEPVTLTSISHHPEGDGYFTTFRWDLDGNGTFDVSGPGKSVTHTFPTAGRQIVGLEASKPGGDKAVAYFAFDVDVAPVTAGGGGATTPPPAATAPTPVTTTPTKLATILAAAKTKVKHGRFALRINFARNAPPGIAVIEVFKGKKKIGTARTRVKRGDSKRVKVKLTKAGRKLLRRSSTKRLKVKVRVRVGKTILRTRTLTIRR